MPSSTKPSKLTIRTYQVGFGDCFLLTFHYPKAAKTADKKRHILIDFGSTGLPEGTPKDQMLRVAEDIRKQCGGEGGKLHVVVGTHRHKDHISGFATDGAGTGTIIRDLNPDVVIQPWTELPDAKRDAKKLTASATDQKAFVGNSLAAHVAALDSMNYVSEAILSEIEHLNDDRKFRQGLSKDTSEQIRFLADDNKLANPSAVKNLATMGKVRHYVNHGYKLNMEKLLPGVKVHVLGPPTIEQSAKVKKQRSADKDEFWMLQAAAKGFWQMQAATGELASQLIAGKRRLFPDAEFYKDSIPAHNRWFVRRMRASRGDQMLGIVRILDNAMNNTSVILLFEVGGKRLLFPGDAQIENWEYALSNEDDMKLLKGVHLYKVGHHGSRNATPKTLWEHFENKGDSEGDPKRLRTVVSTMLGKHGDESRNTEVPRRTLVKALSKSSDFYSTQSAAKKGELFHDIEVTF